MPRLTLAFILSAARMAIVPVIGVLLNILYRDFNLLSFSIYAAGFRVIPFHFFPGFLRSVLFEDERSLGFGYVFCYVAIFLLKFSFVWWLGFDTELTAALLSAYIFLNFNFLVGVFQSERTKDSFIFSIMGIVLVSLLSFASIMLQVYLVSFVLFVAGVFIVYFSQKDFIRLGFDARSIFLLFSSVFAFWIQNFDKISVATIFSSNNESYAFISYLVGFLSVMVSTQLLFVGSSSFKMHRVSIHFSLALLSVALISVGLYFVGTHFVLLFPAFLIIIERLNFPVLHFLMQSRYLLLFSQFLLSLLLLFSYLSIDYLGLYIFPLILLLRFFIPGSVYLLSSRS